MAQNGVGLNETVVFAPQTSQKKYAYRTGLGMVGSAEYSYFMDDFYQFIVVTAITNGPVANTPWSWQGAIIDSGSTVVSNTTAGLGANGVLTFADATASEGAAIYGTKTLQLTAGKKFFMEVRLRTDDVSDNAIQFGLSDLTATTNPEDLWTTTAANVAAFGLLDGSAFPTLLADKANAGTAAIAQTVQAMTVDTWHTLAIGYDGSLLRAYVDGNEVIQTSTTIPTATALAPFIGHINGNGAGAAVVIVDYIRWSSQR
jgi:hypothetical protein